ncbi:MAG TPA: FMN-binding negative transcriptional regulator [Chthoniobacterales bacterium]|nr:FMN-binding negative transcriptional regulator [Chthoniobacterales bacterium]
MMKRRRAAIFYLSLVSYSSSLWKMYVPPLNRVEDREAINSFLHTHAFATLITNSDGKPVASHLPVLFDENTNVLRSHMARANEQWKHFAANDEVLCIFHGPHAYISPSWYEQQHTVPTWNYAVVHVYGKPRLVEEAELKQIIFDTTAKFESIMPTPWKIPLSEQEISAMSKAIVGFKIEITRVEAKFKLGQNRSREDQEKMLHHLRAAPDEESRALAQFIQAQRERN